jgi:hypothetical protein
MVCNAMAWIIRWKGPPLRRPVPQLQVPPEDF